MSDLYGEWMRTHVEAKLGPGTRMNYGADWRLRIEPTIGHRRVSTVTRRVVLEMIGALKEGNVSAGQINKALKTVSSMFAYAVDARIVADNPVLGVRRLPEAKNLQRATYSLADIELVASTARSMRENGWSTMDMDHAAWLGARDYALIRLAVLTGLRWGELAALEWPDVRKDHLLGVARSATLTGEAGEDLAIFLQELSLVSDADQLPDADDDSAVTMMTLHTAKGLEFPRVYMIGLEDNIFPHARALEEANLEEERRLCYVGMTRAQEQLTMTYARTRNIYGRQGFNPPSTFLAEIPGDLVEHERVGTRGGTAMPSARGRWSDTVPTAAPMRRIERATIADLPIISAGDTIRHRTWGEGIVISVPSAEEILVRFPEAGERRLHVAYAPIEVV